MDYEKKYKEVLSRAKAMIKVAANQDEAIGFANTIFPELKESEDERIRKELLEFLDELSKLGKNTNFDRWSKSDCADWIAWLEKQGKQKPVFEIKTPEESLDIDSATYNKIVDECIYGEQKPADKIEPFDKYEGLTDFERTLADICIGWIGEETGWKQYIKDNADVLLKIAVEKFNSVQDASFEQKPTDEEMKTVLRTEYEKGRADAIAEIQKPVDCIDCTNSKGCINCEDGNMKETLVQKPAWSVDDMSKVQRICKYLDEAKKYYADITEVRECINWLKSLKDRVQPRRRHTIFDEII